VLLVRTVFAFAMILCGSVILAEMLQSRGAGFAILPGVVLAGAMIALGAHRISLILRIRRGIR
jgi:hypothetical protein